MNKQLTTEIDYAAGPLCVESIFGDALVDICLDRDIPELGSPILVASVHFDEDGGSQPITASQAEKIARMFAASPKLLAACKAVQGICHELPHTLADVLPLINEAVEQADP